MVSRTLPPSNKCTSLEKLQERFRAQSTHAMMVEDGGHRSQMTMLYISRLFCNHYIHTESARGKASEESIRRKHRRDRMIDRRSKKALGKERRKQAAKKGRGEGKRKAQKQMHARERKKDKKETARVVNKKHEKRPSRAASTVLHTEAMSRRAYLTRKLNVERRNRLGPSDCPAQCRTRSARPQKQKARSGRPDAAPC